MLLGAAGEVTMVFSSSLKLSMSEVEPNFFLYQFEKNKTLFVFHLKNAKLILSHCEFTISLCSLSH
jgi:hypothetical protein